MTSVTFAQTWDVDSRTRIDMIGDENMGLEDRMITSQRATLGVSWEGSNWGIYSSTVVNYNFQDLNTASLSVYEAYASMDLMGFAYATMGRQALNYGSGMIIGSNEWGAIRNTRDGFTFGLDLDMADITVGYDNVNTGSSMIEYVEGTDIYAGNYMYVNASRNSGNLSANLLYVTTENNDGDYTEDLMGLDLGYSMMDGDLMINAMYNTASSDLLDDMDMTMIGATYTVSDNMSISASQTTYGDGGFAVFGGNYGLNGVDAAGNLYNSWIQNGNLGYLGANDQNMSIGGTYSTSGFDLGFTMHTITNENDDSYERNVTEISVGYDMSDNASLSLMMATDDNQYGDMQEYTYTYLTLTVTP